MLLDIKKIYSGFKINRTEFIKEVNAQAYVMEHIQSGARLFYLANDDDNKVFTIGFRTPPTDDTGVAHILEHSTLCGSRKYRLKEPFVDLVKGSLNTFLNAMTYPDKTVYPLASQNEQDFKNLMDVYLDAVFYPLIYENEYTLKQEGWHYELAQAEAPLTYNGVVYNEMKGVYSSADAILDHEGLKALFPDSPYGFESGGLPEAIPSLTQAAFLEFHKTYYSPENSYIYLYGDLDIEAALAHLNEYLGAFNRTGKLHSEIPLQAPFWKTREKKATYPVASGEETKGKTYLEMQIVTGENTNLKTTCALKLLETVLLETEAAPVRRALLDAGLGLDVSGSFSVSLRQPVFGVKISGSEPEKMDTFVKTFYHTLQDLSRRGIDRELLEASLNAMEFRLREADFGPYPKGLIYGLNVYDTWIYDADPVNSLQYDELLTDLRRKLKTNYYEKLIENYLLDNTHKVLLTLVPEPGKEEKEQAAAVQRLAGIKSTLTAEQLSRYVQECRLLHERQGTPDSPEAVASIPLLKRSDIRREVRHIPFEEEKLGANTLYFVPQATNKVGYVNFYFDMTGLEPGMLPYCNLLCDVLGKFSTKEYTYGDLAKLTDKYTGGIAYQHESYPAQEDCHQYSIRFVLNAKALIGNQDKLFAILNALSKHTLFNDLERFREIIGEIKTGWDNDFFARGQEVAIHRLKAYFSPADRVNEADYYTYYNFIKDLQANFADKAQSALAVLEHLAAVSFQKSQVLISYSCDPEDKQELRRQILAYLDSLPESSLAGQPPLPIAAPGLNEGIMTPGKVQYVTAGGNYRDHGYTYHGAMQVLATILRYEYLWTKIRVQGGAYGANASFTSSGIMTLSSYRDPKLKESLAAYRQLPDWLAKLNLTERELTKYVIGTISVLDTPLTNSIRCQQVAVYHLVGSSAAFRQKVRDQILDVKLENLTSLAPLIKAVLADNYLCVVGGKQAIEESQKEFKATVSI